MRRFLSLLLAAAALALPWSIGPVGGAAVLAAQGPPADADVDGVPDADDCAPTDPRVSKYHIYYWDVDGDQFGSADAPFVLCSAAPFPGSSLWGSDSDDNDSRVIGRLRPKGARMLGADVSDPPADGVWRPELVREIGAEAASVTLHWGLIESAPGVFDGPEAAAIARIRAGYAEEGLAINLTIAPITGRYLTLPTDLAGAVITGTRRINDALILERFRALLGFIHASLDGVSVVSVQIGHEVDRFYPVQPSPDFWADYTEFFLAGRTAVRDLWPGMKVGVTATFEGVSLEPVASVIQQLNAGADLVSVTYFPHEVDYTVPDPAAVPHHVASVIARSYPKPVSFQGIGYPSSPRTGSSVARQSQFVAVFFDTWDLYAELIPYAAFSRMHDYSPTRAGAEAAGLGLAGPAVDTAAAWLETAGLRSWPGGGNHKAAYQTLRTQSLNRGWWQVRPSESRSFLMGFAPALYDHNPGGPLMPDVIDTIAAEIADRSDFMAIHFDGGIPWSEAFADTFASVELPYSQNVKEWWAAHRSMTPPGARVLVALNPLGIPRGLMAPYWGVGEGLYHDEAFNRVGTGTVQDYQDRMLPSPWDGYRLNSPQVKTAFLNYARRAIEYFGADYLVTGIEVNLAFEENPQFYDEYVELQQYVYEQLKGDPRYEHVKVIVSFVAEHMMTDEFGLPLTRNQPPEGVVAHLEALARVVPYCDLIGISLYPVKTRFFSHQIPAVLIDDLFVRIRTVTGKPIAITETGYPASNFNVFNLNFVSNPEKQARYFRFLFAELQKHGGVELVTHYSTRDITRYMDRQRARSLEVPPFISPQLIEFYKYFEFIGLLSSDGEARAALATFDQTLAKPVEHPATPVPPVTMTGPGGGVHAVLSVTAGGRVQYAIQRDGITMLEPSPLGVTVDGVDLGVGVTNVEAEGPVLSIEQYPTLGARAISTDRHNEWTVTVRRAGAGDRVIQMVFRVYDGGLAYRYVIPGTGARTIAGEASAWRLPEGSLVWHQTSTANYESSYREAPIGAFDDDLGGPLAVDLPGDGGFLWISEGDLRSYSGMTFDADLLSPLLRSEFLDDNAWQVAGGSSTPWRITAAGATLDDLAHADIVGHVSEAPHPGLFPEGPLTPWIKPGKALWSWWSDFYSGYSYDTQVQFVNSAAALGADYVVVDAWWELGFSGGGLDQFQRLAQLVSYAHADGRNVGIWVWKSWYELLDPAARWNFFEKVALAGVAGVKIDNVFGEDNESFVNVELYEQILREAALWHLLVNFHGSNKPTGLSRTYPNEITREGMMGMELNGVLWEHGLFVPPRHNAALPFVRMLAGPGDYTPVTFDPRKMGDTTVSHQLALAGLFTSPLLHYADHPGVLQWYPEVRDLLVTLPTTWDDTIVLSPSEIGRLAALARRKGSRWYVFVINGDGEAGRTVAGLPLDFLDAGASVYDGVLIGDHTKNSFSRNTVLVNATSSLDVELLPGGGFLAIFTPANEAAATLAPLAPLASDGVAPMQTAELAPASETVAAMVTAAAPAPKGTRILSLDATPAEAQDEAVETAKFFFGIQGVQLMLDWKDIETAPGVYDVSLLRLIDEYYTAKGLAVSLTIRPVDAIHKNVPADLIDVPFDDPRMMFRFAFLMEHVLASLPNVNIASLAIGNEVDEFFRVQQESLPAYKRFYDFAVYYIKTLRPSLKIGFTANLHALTTSGNAGLLQYLNEYSDVILVLYYPMNFDFTVKGPSVVAGDVDALAARYWYKPIHFREAGYPSGPVTGGSDEQQRVFIEEMFKAWDAHADQIELVSFFRFTDFSPAEIDYYAEYYQQDQSPQFRAFLGSLGVRTWFGGGDWKPAFLQLYFEARSRGW